MENQINHITKAIYQGNNQAELQTAREYMGFVSNEWLTFLQAKQVGLKVKKGSKGVSVFKGFNEVDVKGKDGKVKTESKPSGWARVFNLDQTEKFETI